MKMSGISGSTQRSRRKLAASLSSKIQGTPPPPSLLVATPSTDVIILAWYPMRILRRPILRRKGRKSEVSLASSKIRQSAPKKNERHIRRSKLECVLLMGNYLVSFELLTDQSRLDRG